MNKRKKGIIEQTFPVQCKGRSSNQDEFLETPVKVHVRIYQRSGSNMISGVVEDCPHNCGSHGEKCSAYQESLRGTCPYSFDLPYAIDRK